MKTEIEEPEVAEEYYYYDRPICFAADILDQRRLCVLIEDEDRVDVFLVSSPSAEQLSAMENNELPLRDAQLVGPHYRMAMNYTGKATVEKMESEPTEDMLANEGVMLVFEGVETKP